MNLTEEGAKAVSSFLGAFRNEPLSLALITMNVCLLVFFYILLTTVAKQRESEIGLLYADKREVREMLSRCIVPDKKSDLELLDQGGMP